jgi:hypothetical protein
MVFGLALLVDFGAVGQAAVPNDDFAARTPIIDIRVPVEGVNAGASKESGEPNHAGNAGGASVWWSWPGPPLAGRYLISTAGSDFDTLLAVYTGTRLTGLTAVAANNDCRGATSAVFINAAAQRAYHIAVDGDNGATGTVRLAISGPWTRPTNDGFAYRIPITETPPVLIVATNIAASLESGEPNHVGLTGGSSVWWTWTATNSCGVEIDLTGSDFDTLLAVYTGSTVSGLRLVASNDNSGLSVSSRVRFAATQGTMYQIALDGKNGCFGAIRLGLALTNAPTSVIESPVSQTVEEGGNVMLNARVDGLEPLFCRWKRDGKDFVGNTTRTLVFRNVSAAQAGDYTLVAANSYCSVTSAVATLTVISDTAAPRLLAVNRLGLSNRVAVVFSEPVVSWAAFPSNYQVDQGIVVLSAMQDAVNSNLVFLSLSDLPETIPCHLTVNRIEDRMGNRIETATTLNVNPVPAQHYEQGLVVNGFQDQFDAAQRNPGWVVRGSGGDRYVQGGGVLSVTVNQGDPNHLLYEGAWYDPSVQEVLARIRVLRLGIGDGPRAGIGTAVDPVSSLGINYLFVNDRMLTGSGPQAEFLDDFVVWGAASSLRWQTNQWYWMRLHHEPSQAAYRADAFAKLWPDDGVTAEPAAWKAWDYYSSNPLRSGLAGITGSSHGGLAEFEVDYVLIKAFGLPPVTARPSPPSVWPSQRLLVVDEGNATELRVMAGGHPPPEIHWFFNGEPIPGAAGPSYRIGGLARSHEGSYTAVASNMAGQVASAPVVLVVKNVVSECFPAVVWEGTTAGTTTLERTPQLGTSSGWLPRIEYPPGIGGALYVEPDSGAGAHFYRLKGGTGLRFTNAGFVNGWWLSQPVGTRHLIEYTSEAAGWTHWLTLTNLTVAEVPQLVSDPGSLEDLARVYRTTPLP